MAQPVRRLGGFTLIELLVVMAISGILVAMSMPMFTQLIAGSNISGATNTLMGGLQRARSEAISLHAISGICRSANANATTPSCSNTSSGAYNNRDWSVGFIIYRKGDANTGRDIEAGDTVLFRQPAFALGTGSRAAAVSFNTTTINYGPDGLWIDPQTGNAVAPFSYFIDYRDAATATTFTAGDAYSNNRGRCIAVNRLGRPSLQKTCTVNGT